MNCIPQSAQRPANRDQLGWTLVEMMIAVAIGIIVMGAVLATSVYVAKSFVILGNYYDLDKDSRHTLDVFSRDVRSISNVVASATNYLNMVDVNGNQIDYNWNGSNFIRSYNGEAQVMLKDCDYFNMNFYQRNVSNDFTFYPSPAWNEIKLVDVKWHCYRPVLGSKLTTESVQTAKIVVRNF